MSFTEPDKAGTFSKSLGMFPKAAISGKHLPSTNHTEQKWKISHKYGVRMFFRSLYISGTVLCIEYTRKFK